METNDQLSKTDHYVSAKGKWIRLVIWYNKTPVLNKINPLLIIVFAVGVILTLIFPRGECTCADQIVDRKLEVIAKQGNKEVQDYNKSRYNIILCASKRRELLKKIEKEKKLKLRPDKT